MSIIEVDNVVKTFTLSKKQMKINKSTEKNKVAVNGLSFKVEKGDCYGLLGPNGAGKTTTLRMMATLIKPDSGTITIDGSSVLTAPFEVRSKIAFLTSELKLEENFTPSYLFDYYSTLRGIDPLESKKWKDELFQKFGITKFQEVKIGDLSTGMKQKASIAISLVHNPDIIIFDEPTNGLDVITAKMITDFLLSLKAEGKTIIVSTHIFSLIEHVCNRVGVIINGKMVKEDTLENLTKEKNLEDAFFDIYVNEMGGQE